MNYNINQNVNINNNINRNNYAKQLPAGSGGQGRWQHDASHRKGVAYRDQTTAQKFNRGTSAEAARSREAFRGRPEQGRQDVSKGAGGDRTSKPGTAQTRDLQTSKAGQRDIQPGKGTAGGTGQQASRQKAGGAGGQAGQQRKDSAFSGVGNGKQTQNNSNRGSASRSGKSSGGRAPSGGSSSSGSRSGEGRK